MSTIVHFDVPADDIGRQRNSIPSVGSEIRHPSREMQYNLITTTGVNTVLPGVGGGMGNRMDPSQRIMNYFGVKSIDAAMNQVKSLGGKVLHG